MDDLKYQSLEFSSAMHLNQIEQILQLKAALNASG
jgi:hypothetical protein